MIVLPYSFYISDAKFQKNIRAIKNLTAEPGDAIFAQVVKRQSDERAFNFSYITIILT